ncbi:phosphatidylinositol-glycan biosynthesis class X protein isoform 2-T2 [Discoglossus pictus]
MHPWSIILISVWIYLICQYSAAKSTCPDLIVKREILNKGFHRNLVTRLQIQGFAEQVSSCRILLQESIPAGLFLDPDQLTSLHQHNVTEVLLLNTVNVEDPEYLSTGHTALVYAKPDPACTHCYISKVPVHARYQRPSAEDYKRSSVLQSPKLLIRCKKDFPPNGCSHYPVVIAPCGPENGPECDWFEINYTAVSKSITLQIPVGISQHGTAVCSITLLVTLICTGMILTAVHKHGHLYT